MENEMILELPGRHCVIINILLNAGSDVHNNPVQTLRCAPRYHTRVRGKVFIVDSALDTRALVIKVEAPDCDSVSVSIKRTHIAIDTNGYNVKYVYCDRNDACRTLRSMFQKPENLITMVNNWGDLGRGANISEEFYLREIDAAADTGVDVVQIDDGWQIGSSSATRIFDDDGIYTGYHAFDGNFWEIDTTKFPNGLGTVCAYAKTKGVKMGLWFAPDSRDCFGNAARDLAVLKKAYEEGFCCFKLDMVTIRTRDERDAFRKFMTDVHQFGEDVSVQIDVTGEAPRLGFTDSTDLGLLFAENRYCRRDDYYPYQTLHNLWELSRYVPTQVFQFEIPNLGKNVDDYEQDDGLAPVNYTVGWQFVSVSVSNPLLWMELQNFDSCHRQQLKPLIELWKCERTALAASDIRPIGEYPDGLAASGFYCEGEKVSYLIALSGINAPKPILVHTGEVKGSQCLASSCKCTCETVDGETTVILSATKSYAVYKLFR